MRSQLPAYHEPLCSFGMDESIALVGGTGALGIGLALRIAAAGEPVLIGSRDPQRAKAAADKVRAAVPGAQVDGFGNRDAVLCCRRVLLAVPFDGLTAWLADEAPHLGGKLLIDVVVPLAFQNGFCTLAPVSDAPSVGESIQRAVPTARVVSAFKNLPAGPLQDLATPLAADVLLCGDDADARGEVAELVGRLSGLRAVDVGALANARYLEAITAMLVNLNRRHKVHASIAITGL
jgi:8-hydroxy-5-deazaflavin:NADPH oxidoreductase